MGGGDPPEEEYDADGYYTSDADGNVVSTTNPGPYNDEALKGMGIYRGSEIEQLKKEIATATALVATYAHVGDVLEGKRQYEIWQRQKVYENRKASIEARNKFALQNNPWYIMYELSPASGGMATYNEYNLGNFKTAAVIGALTLLDLSELKPLAKLPNASMMLDGELAVARHGSQAKKVGDNITGHHMPTANHMLKKHGIKSKEGISMMMEHPHPGSGGRHRETITYGTQADLNMSSRSTLALGIRDARRIYQAHGLYSKEVHDALYKVIEKNKSTFPEIFKKIKK
jgi:hypothetical protein